MRGICSHFPRINSRLLEFAPNLLQIWVGRGLIDGFCSNIWTLNLAIYCISTFFWISSSSCFWIYPFRAPSMRCVHCRNSQNTYFWGVSPLPSRSYGGSWPPPQPPLLTSWGARTPPPAAVIDLLGGQDPPPADTGVGAANDIHWMDKHRLSAKGIAQVPIGLLDMCREGDPKGWSTVLVTALDSWEKTVPRGHLCVTILLYRHKHVYCYYYDYYD
jgi:hypothetical protein